MPSMIEILVLLLVLSIIQSLFGVGILLFGTPLLLLLGHSYTETLLYLLPASSVISWGQVYEYRTLKLNGAYRKRFFFVTMPVLFVAMLFATTVDINWYIRLGVVLLLFVAFVLRRSNSLKIYYQKIVRKNLALSLGVIGLVHGLSNMGGALLAPLVSALYQDKKKVLAGVSFDYAFMASFQLIILLFIQNQVFAWKYFIGVPIVLMTRHLIGRRVFANTTDSIYKKLIDGLILANALVLGSKLI
jgi:uncharacterized membrane protein YfcA